MTDQLGVGMVGYGFMGAAHSQAWRTVHRAFDVPLTPAMVAICGRDKAKATAAAATLGWASVETDWKRLIARDDVELVDIVTPGDTHAEIAIAALSAGKHVLCEKPLANSVAEAAAMAEAAAADGVRSMVGFNYRRVPAIALARQLVETGRMGTIRHVRAQYLQDWIVDPEFPLVWRLDASKAGSGSLGDLGAHLVDLAQFLTGSLITRVSAVTETFVGERPVVTSSSGLAGEAGTERGVVTVDDAALFTARFDNGALGSFEATRFASGRKNAMRIEVNGSAGSVAFDFESMNELSFHDHTEDPAASGFRRILVTEPAHPYLSAWWSPGHIIGYEHTFIHEVHDLLAAVAASAADGSVWTTVEGS